MLPDCDFVLAIVRLSGRCDADEFIRGLNDRYKARYQRYFEWIRDGKRIKSPQNQRHLATKDGLEVIELKVDAYRLYVVKRGFHWYPTHGVKKIKDNRVPAEIDKAIAIYKERFTNTGGVK